MAFEPNAWPNMENVATIDGILLHLHVPGVYNVTEVVSYMTLGDALGSNGIKWYAVASGSVPTRPIDSSCGKSESSEPEIVEG
eukprot:5015999-Amphidinium_carterae.1